MPNEYGSIIERQGGIGLNAQTSLDSTGLQLSYTKWLDNLTLWYEKLICLGGLNQDAKYEWNVYFSRCRIISITIEGVVYFIDLLSIKLVPEMNPWRSTFLRHLFQWLFRNGKLWILGKERTQFIWIFCKVSMLVGNVDDHPLLNFQRSWCDSHGWSTEYFVSLPANKLELWMALESGRFIAPVFREVYSEKEVRFSISHNHRVELYRKRWVVNLCRSLGRTNVFWFKRSAGGERGAQTSSW